MRYTWVLLLSLLFQAAVTAQVADSLTIANTDISILTCRSGDALYSTFGHTAIRIQNKELALDEVYNYGLFSFDTPNFYVKFMRGQLPYSLGRTQMQYFMREYQYEERSVLEQKLLLQAEEKQEVIRFLEQNILPENREYAYDFFYDNCATRVVDVYDVYGSVGDSLTYDSEIADRTFRDLLKENLHSLPWSEFGIDIVIGARADEKTDRREQMFLPIYLMKNLASAIVHRGRERSPLAAPSTIVLDYEAQQERRQSKSVPWPLICTLMLLLLTVLVNWRFTSMSLIFNKTLLVISGILGLFLLFMWFGTNHGATRDNWNVMWLNPMLILYAIVRSIRSNTLWKMGILLLLVISAINCLFTVLPQFFHFAFLPIILAIIIAVWQLGFVSDGEEIVVDSQV